MEIDPRLKDFRNFLFLAWDQLGLPEPTTVQYDIADYVQNGPKRRCVQAFRGVGKSWITSAYVCHQLLLKPDMNILVVSASKQRADDFSTFTLRLISEMPMLQHLRPGDHQRNSKVAFDVGPAPNAHAPSVTSRGITSQITGSRADLIVADDVESLNSATQTMRDKLGETIKEFDAVLKPGGHILYLGTPQTEQSIYNSLPQRGYDVRIWPARYPGEKQRTLYGDKLAPIVSDAWTMENQGTPTDPGRFDEFDLLEREASYGRSGFDLQFMLDTTLSDAGRYPLRLSDLIIMNLNPDNAPEKVIWAAEPNLAHKELPNVGFSGDRFYRPMAISGDWVPYTGSVMAIDPSGRGADETSYCVCKMMAGTLYITDIGGLPGGYSEETLVNLSNIAKEQKVNAIIVESNFGDGMFTELMRPVLKKIHPCSMEEVRHSVQKERRIIDTLEPVMNQHRLCIDERLVEKDFRSTQHLTPEKALQYQLFYQMTRITRQKGALVHDDRLDVLSIAVNYWVEQMAADADSIMDDRKERLRRDALESFMDSVVGRKAVGDTWM